MKRVVFLAVLAALGYLGYGIVNAGRDERPPPGSNTDIRLNRGHATGQRVKFRSWSADYERIISNADQTVLDIRNVRNGTIYKAGKPYIRVRATRLMVNTISRDFSSSGPLHAETVATVPARTFDTTSAVWNDASQKLTLAHRVVIRTGSGEPLTVGSLTLNVKTGDIEVHDIAGPVPVK